MGSESRNDRSVFPAASQQRNGLHPAGRALLLLLIAAVLLPPSIAARGPEHGGAPPGEIRGSMTLSKIARDQQVPASWLIERLNLPPDTSLDEPLRTLKDRYGFRMEAVREAAREYRSGRVAPPGGGRVGSAEEEREGRGRAVKTALTPLILALYGLFSLAMLMPLVKNRLSERLRLSVLFASVLLFGIAFQAAVHPFHSIIRVFQALGMGLFGVRETLFIFLAFALMTAVGVKLVCGWGCPAGTLQELLYDIPVLKDLKKKRAPFWISNGVRTALFAIFLVFVFGWISGLRDQSVYRYFNPFKLFDLDFRRASLAAVLLIYALSVVQYRPFCMWACPFGLFSWLIQNLGLYGIRVGRETCVDCGICARACPTGAAEGILKGKAVTADCFSCGRCLPGCPNGSIRYGLAAGKGNGNAGA